MAMRTKIKVRLLQQAAKIHRKSMKILMFWLFETRFKFCFAKTWKKWGKCWILTSQNHPQTLQNRIKINVPKNIEIFIGFRSIFTVCCKSRTLIFVRMAIVLLGFYTIHAFAFGMRFGNQNHAKNASKTRPEPFKNRCRKHVDFQHRFSEVLASIWEGLGPPRWSQVRYFGPPKLLNSSFFTLLS